MYRRIPEVKLPQSPSIKIIQKTDKTTTDKDESCHLEHSAMCFDPNHMSTSPPNPFLADLKKRIELYR
jgi:hypothetical protein